MKRITVFIIVLLMPSGVWAWDGSGHMTAGAIAYYYLKVHNPAVLSKVLATLRLHPWYNQQHWKDTLALLKPDEQDAGLFMLASTYPDDAKKIPHFIDGDRTHKLWHYIDYPFVAPGSSAIPQQPKSPNAQEKLNELVRDLPAAGNSSAKAVNLAWLFHLIEDIHQPLHTAQLFDADNPGGDSGGLKTFIRIDTGSPRELHGVWDELVKGKVKTYPANASRLLAMDKYKESNLPELSANPKIADWILKESFLAAKQFAYLDGTVAGTQSHPTTVHVQYLKDASPLGEKRVVLSGIRLAKLLVTIYHG
ncbi:S1/P1 nuclease [Mucilaginibacter celer]|uniref:S1/P1 nuclease n=1 Tax=Mucilaginibacter celer TaxID=2305508 RepID=A0A494VK10_9SPHI|nr:S1/P1 nuclease [Mucilaginibacter celer]AYL94239.1 hypothetical protein HYN43_002545 [Mucilaginibacter celer]